MPIIKRLKKSQFEFIESADVNKMLAAGTARKVNGMPAYEEIAKAQAPQDLDSVPDEDPPQQYQTKVMEAAPRATPRRRRTPKDTNV